MSDKQLTDKEAEDERRGHLWWIKVTSRRRKWMLRRDIMQIPGPAKMSVAKGTGKYP